jgi:ABC-type multidrug transport system fused ATPase/permease subunit
MFGIADMTEGAKAPPEGHSVTFDKVTFAYGDREVIKNLTLAMPENTLTALVGESGAGKSTLAKLALRFWDVQEGAVKIGGLDISEFPQDALADSISYVSQDNFLFNVSIMENIRYGRPGASDDEVIEMAKAA